MRERAHARGTLSGGYLEGDGDDDDDDEGTSIGAIKQQHKLGLLGSTYLISDSYIYLSIKMCL